MLPNGIIEHFIEWDWNASVCLAQFALSHARISSNIRQICLLLEWSMHGIPWLIVSFSIVLFAHYQNWPEDGIYKANLLLAALLVDLAIVGILKIAIQRKRPEYNINDQVYEAPIADQFSFPSGHSSRASMLSSLFIWNMKTGILWAPFSIFAQLLAISRVLMGRHYISDAVAGFFLGKMEAFLVLMIPREALYSSSELIMYQMIQFINKLF